MAMRMQAYLNVGDELGALTELPAEVAQALANKGFPALKASRKLKTSFHETFLVEFGAALSEDVAPPGSSGRGARDRAIVQILGAQLGDKPLFSPDALISSELIGYALALAEKAGVAAPRLWCGASLPTRGALRDLQFVVLECIETETVEDQVNAPDVDFDCIVGALRDALASRAVDAEWDGGHLPCFDDVHAFLAHLRALARTVGAGDLDVPLAKLEAECTTKWKPAAAPPTLIHQDLNRGNVLCSQRGGKAWALDGLIDWESAAAGDARLAYASGSPWQEARDFAHVVKGRWLVDLARRAPERAPRCEVGEILEAHDEAQKRLAEGGWLPAEAILAGTSNANLAVTFPEELSPHYGGSSRAMWKPDDGEEGGD